MMVIANRADDIFWITLFASNCYFVCVGEAAPSKRFNFAAQKPQTDDYDGTLTAIVIEID